MFLIGLIMTILEAVIVIVVINGSSDRVAVVDCFIIFIYQLNQRHDLF